MTDDPYARSEYRRLIAWDSRIEREKALLLDLLDAAPDRSVLDIGCGTGEHTAFFARSGARAVGIDSSPSMIEKAREHEAKNEGRFVLGDAASATELLPEEPPFGLVTCLGNMLPHLREAEAMQALFAGVWQLLAPGGVLLLQILNYRRILDQGIRYLPINFREGDGNEEIVFVRLIQPVSEDRVLFFPTTLTLDPESDEPVSVKMTRRVELRPWTSRDLVPMIQGLGFETLALGDMEGREFLEQESPDLVLVATRR